MVLAGLCLKHFVLPSWCTCFKRNVHCAGLYTPSTFADVAGLLQSVAGRFFPLTSRLSRWHVKLLSLHADSSATEGQGFVLPLADTHATAAAHHCLAIGRHSRTVWNRPWVQHSRAAARLSDAMAIPRHLLWHQRNGSAAAVGQHVHIRLHVPQAPAQPLHAGRALVGPRHRWRAPLAQALFVRGTRLWSIR